MATAAQLTYLQSNNPDRHGVSVRVVDNYSSPNNGIVSANYILFPGDNVSAYASEDAPNSFINKTVTLGSSDLVQLGRVTGPPVVTTLNLFVDMSATLCNYDYYLVVSLLYADGTSSPFQTVPVLIPLTPAEVTISTAVLVRNYPQNTTILATFAPQQQACVSDLIKYNAAVQWMDGSGVWNFLTQEVDFDTGIGDDGGVEIVLPSNDVDEAYLALQAIRLVDDNNDTRAIGALGDTFLVSDSDVPDAPINFAGVYNYSSTAPNFSMTWNAAPSSTLTETNYFLVYRSVNGGVATAVSGQIAYVNVSTLYSFVSPVPEGDSGFQIGDVLTYYVVAVNGIGESLPSSTLTIHVVAPSSPPQNLTATGLREIVDSEASIQLLFQNPAEVNGDPYGAYFTINIYNGTTRLETRDVPYNATAANYIEGFSNVDYYTTYTIEVFLNTLDAFVPGGIIAGQSATTTISVNFAPLVTNVNGVPLSDRWQFDDPLTSFDVYSFQALAIHGMRLTEFNGVEADPSITLQTLDIPDPETVVDPYGAFDGAYLYHFNVAAAAGALFIQISTSNASGLTTVAIRDRLAPAPPAP